MPAYEPPHRASSIRTMTATIEPMYTRIDTVLPSVLFQALPVAFRTPDNGSGDFVKTGPL